MIAVLVEVRPRGGTISTRRMAAALLETLDGFVSVERFESLSEPGTILSPSLLPDA